MMAGLLKFKVPFTVIALVMIMMAEAKATGSVHAEPVVVICPIWQVDCDDLSAPVIFGFSEEFQLSRV